MKNLALALSIIFAVISTSALAEGNAEAGKAKAVMCAACHGMDGNSMIPLYPKLAGQHPEYLAKQLHDFKAGSASAGKKGRFDPIMAGFVVALTDQDIEDISAFFATQKISAVAGAKGSAAGEKLFKAGDVSRGITSCMACHGPKGKGMGLAGFPAVASQQPDYLKSQLTKFRSGDRHNDLNGMMSDVAKKLTDADIDALAQYLASLK
ncbi:MAG: c-type cytochrome [Parashewanella sp.]